VDATLKAMATRPGDCRYDWNANCAVDGDDVRIALNAQNQCAQIARACTP
jgi:hypothetical protein